MKQHLPNPDLFIGKTIPGLPGYTIVELVGSGCNAHVFRAHSDSVHNDMAVKIIPLSNLVGNEEPEPAWRQEVYKAQSLDSEVVVRFWNVYDWDMPEAGVQCVALCSQFVRGISLEEFIKAHRGEIAVSFVEQFLNEMMSFFYDMIQHNVRHGDLHAKNILVEDRSALLGGTDHGFRVTDFGVATATSTDATRDDFDMLASVLKQLLENVDYQQACARDRYVYNVLNDHFLSRHLVERDPTRDQYARNPEALYRRLQTIDQEFNRQQGEATRPEMLTPFDFLSCEQIGDAHLLLKTLYSDKFLGIADVEARTNLVLTGPRGCGKSTVFKSLSLKHRVAVGEDDPNTLQYVGIYYRCDDLYAGFPRYVLPEREDAYDIPVHFLTASLISELLTSIELWARRHFLEEFDAREEQMAEKIWRALGSEPPKEPGANRFHRICSRMQKERKRASDKQRFVQVPGEPIGTYLTPDVLGRVCEVVESGASFLQGKYFYFFVDDYSAPKITIPLQSNLNRLLMQRSARCFFKLSTESPVSYCRSDVDGKAYVEGREFVYLNLGLVYLSAQTSEKLDFVEDVLTRRFTAVPNYPVKNLQDMVGSYSPPSYNEVALAIRRSEKPDMWGKEVLCDLCSGDIFYVISLVGRMVAEVRGERLQQIPETEPVIPPPVQTRAIRGEAGAFLNSLRGVKDGEHLVQVVTSFGTVAHSYLMYRTSKNEEGDPPHLASRIEPYEQLDLSAEAERAYTELLRYSLFIEDPRGKSRRGKVVPRLYIRRALIPHFNLTFSRRDSIELENESIELLLTKPREFENRFRLKSEADGQKAEAREANARNQTVMESILRNTADNKSEGAT